MRHPDLDETFLDALRRCKEPRLQGFDDAWVGMEPTFSSKKAVKKWAKMSAEEGGEDAYFEDRWMRTKMRSVGRRIEEKYEALRNAGDPACLFGKVTLVRDLDPWKDERVNLQFSTGKRAKSAFEVRFGMDPETFEFSIKPVPVAWLYDPRFVRFLQLFVWDVPEELGLVASIGHGGGQFSFSAKTWLEGSLLADDIATRLDHPELSTWICDYPNCDDRSFRATAPRLHAFEAILAQYWRGAFHPAAVGPLRARNALLDYGFSPAASPPEGLMGPRGPVGDAREVFLTNFAFGRAVRWRAQNVEPGYWQAQHPDEVGYRPDQIMRYGEGNLNRLQIAGELHVKSGEVLDADAVPELDAPLDLGMLFGEASWEQRAQMAHTSAESFVEAILLDVHHAAWLKEHPRVVVRSSLAQDRILGGAEATLERSAPKVLARLRKEARAANLEASQGRLKTDFIEPETIFWHAWKALGKGEQAEIAREAIAGFVERVERAASADPRGAHADPMEAHRHRVHPILWEALSGDGRALDASATLRREAARWRSDEERYSKRRPTWSPTGEEPPWA